ncbi:MAG: C40 family peptidase [Lachnospiraceae bacterium]|nr:C40 family peptidase [Lachnospiraceae bacterium]MBR1523125.1 C40 family peptidase [Lachnospiraceae bacterium]
MKKRRPKIISFLLACVMLAELSGQYTYADTKSDLQKDANANKSKLDQAQSEAESIESEKETAESELEEAQQQLVQLLAEVDILKSDIENKKAEIAQAEEDYDAAKKEEDRQYNTMRARIKYMYENGTNSSTEYLDILFHADSLTDALNKAAYAEKLAEYDRNMLNKFIEAKDAVAERKKALEDDLSELEEEETDLEEREQELNNTIEEQRSTIENFSSKLAAARSEAKAYQKKIEEDNAQIARIVAAEKEAARKKAEEEAAKKKAAEEAAKKKKKAEEASISTEETKKEDKDTGESSEEKEEEKPEEKSEEKEDSGSSDSGKGAEIASYAQQFIGNPYVPGGTSLTDGCDCSGFVQSVYSHFGYSLPRQSGAQGASGKAVNGMENAQPGDIFYYVGHVGIYIGNGYIVHASTPETGIKITPATYRSVSSIRRIV